MSSLKRLFFTADEPAGDPQLTAEPDIAPPAEVRPWAAEPPGGPFPGVTQEEQTLVEQAQRLIGSLPPGTPPAVAVAALTAFGKSPADVVFAATKLIEAATAAAERTRASGATSLQDANRLVAEYEGKLGEAKKICADLQAQIHDQSEMSEAVVRGYRDLAAFFAPAPAPVVAAKEKK